MLALLADARSSACQLRQVAFVIIAATVAMLLPFQSSATSAASVRNATLSAPVGLYSIEQGWHVGMAIA